MKASGCLLVFILAMLSSATIAQSNGSGSLDKVTINKVDEIFARYDSNDSPGCALGMIKDGKLIYARGYGMANLEYNAPITSQSVFYIASTSKQFAAASIALLARKGTISLDDDIRKYLLEIPQYEGTITIRHLIHHTSGLRDYLELRAEAGISGEDIVDNNDAIEMIARQKALNYKPGEKYLYSNSNYVLLAEIVKRASGKSLREFAAENIFQPLGMKNTHWDDDRSMVVKNRVVSYGVGKQTPWRHFIKNINAVGDGNLLTTIEDLAKWDQNFYDNKVGGAGFTEYLLTRGKLNNGEAIQYAFGLGHEEYRGVKNIAHGGAFLGFRTQMMRFPEQKFSVICLCNSTTINPTLLSQKVADVFLADQLKPVEIKAPSNPNTNKINYVTLPESQLQEYVGSYYSEELNASYKFNVTQGQLLLKSNRQEPMKLNARAKDSFDFQFGTLNFLRNDQGQIHGFSFDGGRVKGIRFLRQTK